MTLEKQPDNVLVRMEHINKTFGAVKALIDAEFTLLKGEVHALLGENGAGKSTLIKVLTGVEHRDNGTVYLNGSEINPKHPFDAQNLGISTVYQEVNLSPNLSVAENIFIGRQPTKRKFISWKTLNEKAREVLKNFDLDIDVTRTLDSYPVAIQQMVAIARAVDIDAKVLILDEPTSSLSAVEVEKLFSIMRKLRDDGIGIVFVTHFLDQVYQISDRITVLRNGTYAGTYNASELDRVQLVSHMLGRNYDELQNMDTASSYTPNNNEKNIYLTLENETEDEAVLEIEKGQVTGLSGLLGSGRTETARRIFGLDPLKKGETLTIKDKQKRFKKPITAIRAGNAFCPEDRKKEGLVGDLSIRENIVLALQTKRGMLRPVSKAEAQRIADKYIKELKIKTPNADQLIKNLSGGNQQKVILARCLATNPDFLILDEPTRGIDIGAKAEIQKITLELAKEGLTVMFISSELDEMIRNCNKIAVLRDGKRISTLSGAQITEAALMKEMAGGQANGE